MKENYTGFDMWKEYCEFYGRYQARLICNEYIGMQLNSGKYFNDDEEHKFFDELFSAMEQDEKED